MSGARICCWLAACVWLLLPSGRAVGEPPAPAAAQDKDAAAAAGSFLRVIRDLDGTPLAMQTSIVRYVKPISHPAENGQDRPREPELVVDLIGAVHVGDTSYYEALNKQFKEYDALLYELVAPTGTRVPQGGGRTSHPVGAMQRGLQSVLELDYQLDRIDYQQPNFVHADMSPEQFARSMADRGESVWGMLLKLLEHSIKQQHKLAGRTSDAEIMAALLDPNGGLALKRVMADQFEHLGDALSPFHGEEGSTILTERNKVALEVLKQQIAAGKKRLGIFYGAAHLEDMEKRLLADFGLQRDSQRWLTAWNMTGVKKKRPR